MHSLSGMLPQAAVQGFTNSLKQNAIPRNSQGLMLPSSLTRPPGCNLHASSSSQSLIPPSSPSSRDGAPSGWSNDLFENSGDNIHGCLGDDRIQDDAILVNEQTASSYFGVFGIPAELHDKSVPVNGFALAEICILELQSCRETKELERARLVHLHVCSYGLETHKAVENYIVPMFVECGSIKDAQLAFYKLSCKREHSWTSLILGYCELGQRNHAFHIFRQMQDDREEPSMHTFSVLLRASATDLDVDFGRRVHIEVVKKGLGKDNIVGDSLISMYSKCGSLPEAWVVFEEYGIQDMSSWTLLISGYAEHGLYSEALGLFEEMKLEGVNPGTLTYTCSLKVCGHLGGIVQGSQLHTELALKGLEGDLFVGSTLVWMYAKCGYLEEAQEVFDKMPVHDVVSWNALITGYVDSGVGQEALTCYERMKEARNFPDAVTYAINLKACGSTEALWKGQEIHTELVLVGSDEDVSLCKSLVGMYAKCGSLLEAHVLFYKLPAKDIAAWTSLISGYTDYGPVDEALNCLEQMQLEGFLPDVVVLACGLKACSVCRTLDRGQKIHINIVKRGYEREFSVGVALVSMYAKVGLVFEAQKVSDNLPVRDVVLWTALIAGYADYGYAQEVSTCLRQMQCEGVAPNVVTFVCSLGAFGKSAALTEGQEIHLEIVCRGYEADLLICNALIAMYLRCGSLVEALNIFGNMQAKDAVSWNTIITGLAEHESSQEALIAFNHMQDAGHSPDAVTLASIFKVCGSVGALEKGRQIHMEINNSELIKEAAVGNSLISMYAKCGSSRESLEVFHSMPVRDVVSWSTMIKAHGMNHEGEKAIQCFEDMQEQGVKPDSVTFACLLLACSHSGLVSEGQDYLKKMRESYGIVPALDHYACVIDCLARSGHLYEAESFLTMICTTSEVTWASLLSGCKTYGEAELGFRCFQELVKMNSGIAAWYVPMEDIYLTAGKWEAVKKIEELRKHSGAVKKPASAFIEINHRVFKFMVGHKGNAEVVELLSSLSARVKEQGHLPNIESSLHEDTDIRKEAALCEHAEKVALAFGLLNTAPGATLRLTKNLRMCNDCHSTSKIISKVEGREIILRDDCCIHRFKNGLCSCGDSY